MSSNVYAPPAYAGVNPGSPAGYEDEETTYIYDTILAGNAGNSNDSRNVDNDADFVLRGVVITTSTDAFSVRWSDSQGYWLQNARILSGNIPGDMASPFPQFPEAVFPAGGRIGIDILDLSGSQNTIQIAFRGVKRYRTTR